MTEIDSATASSMVDASASELFTELNAKRRKLPLWVGAVAATVVVAVLLGGDLAIPILLVGAFASVALAQVDMVRRSTVLLYDLEGPAAERYQALHDVFAELVNTGRVGHLGSKGTSGDRKYHAGASTLVIRTTVRPKISSPPLVKTNIAVPAIPVGQQTLYLFPDRLLVWDRNGVGGVAYQDLRLSVQTMQFIENETVPHDAKVVGQTWKYLNKKGGPDKRFKGNRELPIVLYEEISFQSDAGLNEVIQVSRLGLGEKISAVLSSSCQQNLEDQIHD